MKNQLPAGQAGYLALILLLCCSVANAQDLLEGPDFFKGGYYLFQRNIRDLNYDPYVVEWNFSYLDDLPEREAIVDLRLDVLVNGRVENLEVLGGFYSDEVLEKILHEAAQIEFKPAKNGSESVAWPDLELRIILRGPYQASISDNFAQDYERIVTLVRDKNYTEAEPLVTQLLQERILFLYEYALLQDQLASIYMGTERPYLALKASRNATAKSHIIQAADSPLTRIKKEINSYTEEYMPSEQYLSALGKRFLIALSLNQTGELLTVFGDIENRANLKDDDQLIASVKPRADKVSALLDSEEPIGSVVKLVQGKWSFQSSSRRVYGVTGLQGQVDYIDFNCKGSVKKRMAFQNDSEWKIPESWGQCQLEFQGAEDSQFYLYEYLN